MKIALPLSSDDLLADHYGEATRFRIFDLSADRHTVLRRLLVVPDQKRPCQWPTLLRAAGVSLLITGRIGEKARTALLAKNIQILAGIRPGHPEATLADWMTGSLSIHLETADCHCHHGEHSHHPEEAADHTFMRARP